jgi:hypothetical protein
MTTLERIDALVRGSGSSDVAMPSGGNPDSESDVENVIRVPLPSVQEGKRKRKVEDLERIREWQHPSLSQGFREAPSCDFVHYMRDGKATRSGASRCSPSVSYPRTLCNEEGPEFLSYRVQLNENEKPASASLDRLLKELSTVTVANSSVPDKCVLIEATDNELLSSFGVDSEEKLSPNSFHEGKASLPDLNENLAGVEGLAIPEVSCSRTKQLRRIRQGSHLKLKLCSERITTAGLHERRRSLNYQSMLKTGTEKVEEKATSFGFDWEHKPEKTLLQ